MSSTDATSSALLKAATPDLYRRNAFRLTGLMVTASAREVARQADKLKMLAEVGGNAADQLSVIPGMEAPTADEVREASQRLKDVEARALDEFFWFWPEDWGKPDADEAFVALKRHDLDAAFSIWAQREVEAESFIAARNVALVLHMRAIEWALLDFDHPLPQERLEKVHGYWQEAFNRWEWLADDDRLWEAFKARIRQVDDPALTTGFARRLRSELPQAFDKINAELALTYAEKGRNAEALWHVDFLKSTHAGTDDTASTIGIVLAPIRSRLERAMGSARKKSQSDKNSGIAYAKQLLDTAEPLLAVIDMFHEADSLERCQLFDELAECALDGAVLGYNASGQQQASSPIGFTHTPIQLKQIADAFVAVLGRAESIATDLDLRQRISENIRIAEGNLNFTTKIKPLLDRLAAIQKQTSASPSDRLKRIKNDVIPLLDSLFQPGVLDRAAQNELCNAIAIVLRGIALSANNDFHQPGLGMESLTLAVKYARDRELIARLKQDSQTMQQNMAASSIGQRSQNSGKGCLWALGIGFVVLVVVGQFEKPKTPARPYGSNYTPSPSYTAPVNTPEIPAYTPPRYVPVSPAYEPVKPMVYSPPVATAAEPQKKAKTLADWQIDPDVSHTLRNLDGKEIVAKVNSFDGTNVILTTSENTHTYPVNKLSEESQQLVRELDRLRKRPKPQQLPLTDVLTGRVAQSRTTGPLVVKTRPGSGNYYVKLVEKSTGITRMTFFVREGATTNELAVPAGNYEMRYATGKTWYGEDALFGDETTYNKADSDFNIGYGNGYTVELYLQQFGNLETHRLNKDSF